ncbi:MAG: bifunctional phosphopantothenoylcysteine decarboxylase/phosphopantothenate--cysteine ligase CoaBC [Alphaproteobacteria bacterium]|nr:bifunctional phosphopantothenoylcysteine decarboxylase/phosphopantothenate--cysteine ligase CoaBC [Alphaproteobacteria bacterium]
MNTDTSLYGRRIVLIISGGISAYKALDLIRRLKERGAEVRCILTKGGAEFITPLSVSALSEEKVYTDLFSLTDEHEMGHIRLARDCDMVLAAPASANLLARYAEGRADDLAATVLLATDKPVMLCPAMNPAMWDNAATQENISTLEKRGAHIMKPASGLMACGETGEGRLPEVSDIVQHVCAFFEMHGPLNGLKALVTSGPTHEPIDPVRYICNRSSGKQGHAIANALHLAGAEVTLITGPVDIPNPKGVRTVRVTTAEDMLQACLTALPADIAVCAAAVGDFRAANTSDKKIKKDDTDSLTLSLVQNPDILQTIAKGNNRPRLVIGFAAETDDAEANARRKLESKGCDWIALNSVAKGAVFGDNENTLTLFCRDASGKIEASAFEKNDKSDIARQLVEKIAATF